MFLSQNFKIKYRLLSLNFSQADTIISQFYIFLRATTSPHPLSEPFSLPNFCSEPPFDPFFQPCSRPNLLLTPSHLLSEPLTSNFQTSVHLPQTSYLSPFHPTSKPPFGHPPTLCLSPFHSSHNLHLTPRPHTSSLSNFHSTSKPPFDPLTLLI